MNARTIEFERRIHARPETVFRFFTDPERYRRWQGSSAELDPRPGGRFRVDYSHEGGCRGEFLVVEPPRRLVLSWGWEATVPLPSGLAEVPPGSSTVEITLEPDGEHTILRLRHSGLPTDDACEMHSGGWNTYLGRLDVVSAGGDPGPDPVVAMLESLGDERPPGTLRALLTNEQP